MTEQELKGYVYITMKALHLACDELSKARSIDIRDDNEEMIAYLAYNGADGLVNYFLHKAEEENGLEK